MARTERTPATRPNLNRTPLFAPVPDDAKKILDAFDSIVQSVRPLSSKQHLQLPKDIRALSHLLTDERRSRRTGYLNETATLSAYVRYYQWWNLVRLTRLFAGLGTEAFDIPANGVCLDVGSGPLTIPIALWLARPDLREKPLHWYCMDTSQSALSLGENLFLAVAARTAQTSNAVTEPWKITRIKGEPGTLLRYKADFISCANIFNEMVQVSEKPPEFTAKRASDFLSGYASDMGSVLVVEPGIPPAVRFLSAFRSAMMRKDWNPTAPCLHTEECPMDGKRGGKWCHFVFSAEADDIPTKLKKLSDASGLTKDRAALSFVLLNRGVQTKPATSDVETRDAIRVRIASDAIRLPGGRSGYYGCSRLGLTLVTSSTQRQSTEKHNFQRQATGKNTSTEPLVPLGFGLESGDVVTLRTPVHPKTDGKSGATIIEGNL